MTCFKISYIVSQLSRFISDPGTWEDALVSRDSRSHLLGMPRRQVWAEIAWWGVGGGVGI